MSAPIQTSTNVPQDAKRNGKQQVTTEPIAILEQFQIDQEVAPMLPPNVRDQLLDYLQAWGRPQELLTILDLLQATHGALLFLLDYQADALYRLGNYQPVLTIVERRQRRSTTLASQMMEARALLGLGHEEHARAVADDISQAFANNAQAISTAAEIYAALGNFELGRELLESYLSRRKGDLQATISMIWIAQQHGQQELVSRYLGQLGAGISPNMSDAQLQRLATILAQSTHRESADAAQLELQRRQLLAFEKLQNALTPFLPSAQGAAISPGLILPRHNGPEAITVSRQEEREIQLSTVRHFGFSKLRAGQIETIATVLRGESILTVMPTGAGKSLCYQLPALTLPHMTLVISPLIALMKDQVESLPTAARAQATFINSTLDEEELVNRMAKVAKGEYKLIYAAPERLRQREFLRALRQGGVALFVIDEAHCVSLWGHDFRPDYLFVQEARLELGAPTTLAMTATAPPRIRDEILDYIGNDQPSKEAEATTKHGAGRRPQVLAMDIFRHNLHLSAVHFHNEEEKLAALLKFAGETKGSGIVYVNSRHKAEQLAYQLRQANISAEAYHAGLENRGAVQDRFMGEKTRIVVATIAFGMGIDKANIRFIVHFHPSRSLAAYYQEVGRAGRDGKPSQGVLFYSNNDWANLRRWAKADEHSIEFLEKVYAAIAAQLGMLKPLEAAADSVTAGEAGETEIDPILASLEQHTADRVVQATESVLGPVEVRRLQQVLNTDETTVRVAVSVLERAGLIDRSFDFPQDLTVAIPRSLSAAAKADEEFSFLLQGLAMRPGQSANFKTVDIAKFMGWSLDITEGALLDWQAKGWLTLKGSRRAMLIELPPRPDDLQHRLQRLIEQSQAVAQRRIDDIIGYATAESCRHGYISAHFGSPPRIHCEVCDSCTGIRPEMPERSDLLHVAPDDADIEPMIIDCLISLPKPVGRSGLARILTGSLRAPVTADKARHFGQLKSFGESGVIGYIDDLLEDSRLRQYERQGYNVLAPTMKGRTQAELWLAEHPELAAYADAPAADETIEEALPAEGDKYTALQKALWLWRRNCAAQQGQPPYVIMSNDLMLRIAELRPQSLEELGTLPGMGEQRLQHYGPTILDLVKLNLPQEGDAALMVTQRTSQAEAIANAKEKIHANQAAVSPQLEKKIFMKLQEIRQKKAIGERSKPYLIASNTILKAIAQHAPTTKEGLEAIVGFRSCGLKDDVELIAAEVQKIVGTAGGL